MNVYINKKRIGKVDNEIFSKVGMILWLNKSIGSDIETLNHVINLGAKIIQVKVKNYKNQIFETEIDNFKKFGEQMQFEGYDKQIFLPLNYWRII